jgi:hypothetical protein
LAEALASYGHNSDPLAGISQADYLRLLEQYDDADQAVADAVAERKDLRAKIKSLGVPLRAWDRARRDAEVSGEKRETEERAYRQMMAWRLKPVGFQASMDLQTEDPGLAALNTHELHFIDGQGFDAGKRGRRRDSNSYTPGTEAYQRWDTAWVRGQAEIASTMGGNGASDAARETHAAAAPAPKRRGRPPGAKTRNRKAAAQPAAAEEAGQAVH